MSKEQKKNIDEEDWIGSQPKKQMKTNPAQIIRYTRM